MLTINSQEFLKLTNEEKAKTLKNIVLGNVKYIDTNKQILSKQEKHIPTIQEDKEMSKYHNKKVTVDNYVLDSIAESKRYKELFLL